MGRIPGVYSMDREYTISNHWGWTDESSVEPEINIDIYAPGVANQTVSGRNSEFYVMLMLHRRIRFQDRRCGRVR